MKIKLICVGKVKEEYYRKLIEEYKNKISKKVNFEIIEVLDEKTPENASNLEEIKIKDTEGQRILRYIGEKDFLIALCIDGKMIDNRELTQKMINLNQNGVEIIDFVIGGSLGLSLDVINRANFKLSFSKMTFPHQLMRVILLEALSN